MDANKSKQELLKNLNKYRNDINIINKNLNLKNYEKESHFKNKKNLSEDIRTKITNIKENKQKRDALTKKVKELKEKRDKFNQEIKRPISELIKLKNNIKDLTKKSKVRNPDHIMGEIDKIEVTLETEPMPCEKEKELSKKLKIMKKSLIEASEIAMNFDKIRKITSEVNDSKKKSNETHNEIQKLAEESQKLHLSIIKASKEIDKLSIKEEETFRNFIDSKKNFKEINNKLKEKLRGMGKITENINKFRLEEEEKKKLNEGIIIKNKEHELEEKIKKGKKLTTDDFLAFQEIIKGKN